MHMLKLSSFVPWHSQFCQLHPRLQGPCWFFLTPCWDTAGRVWASWYSTDDKPNAAFCEFTSHAISCPRRVLVLFRLHSLGSSPTLAGPRQQNKTQSVRTSRTCIVVAWSPTRELQKRQFHNTCRTKKSAFRLLAVLSRVAKTTSWCFRLRPPEDGQHGHSSQICLQRPVDQSGLQVCKKKKSCKSATNSVHANGISALLFLASLVIFIAFRWLCRFVVCVCRLRKSLAMESHDNEASHVVCEVL